MATNPRVNFEDAVARATDDAGRYRPIVWALIAIALAINELRREIHEHAPKT